jgi:hypothetical protein
MVKLGIILLVKLNGAYRRLRMTTGTFLLCAKMLMKLTLGGEVEGGKNEREHMKMERLRERTKKKRESQLK